MSRTKNTKNNLVKLQENENNIKTKKFPKWFYLILLLLPVLLLILCEMFLRSIDYGKEFPQWTNYEKNVPGLIQLNPETARKYFTNIQAIPTSIGDPFDKEKKPNSIRIFVLGESSAAGFPFEPNGSFSRYLRDGLRLLYPSKNIEVVNAGISAISSFVIKDLLPGILAQKPDLILIYTGHNEYYGALGVSSTESAGSSSLLINLSMKLSKFKLYKLVANLINSVSSTVATKGEEQDGTLMSKMAKDKLIPYQSDTYKAGIDQFKSNLEYILTECRDKNVPVILSTIVSNLRDMAPFESVKDKNGMAANDYFQKANDFLKMGDTLKAKENFVKAKDADALKFRAPSEINNVIKSLALTYKCKLIDSEEKFNKISPLGIVGSNLLVDHLHPTLNGYQILGKYFIEEILNTAAFSEPEKKYSIEELDVRIRGNFAFSQLDSVIAKQRLASLMNGYPFNKDNRANAALPILKSSIDSIAYNVVNEGLDWHKAHLQMADIYSSKNNISAYTKEMNVLIEQFPYILPFYESLESELLRFKEFNTAYKYFSAHYKIKPDAFVTKWLGIIDVSKGDYDSGIKYLQESTKFDNTDPQVYFNLAGAFVNKRDFKNALTAVNSCLSIDSEFPGAMEFKKQVQALGK